MDSKDRFHGLVQKAQDKTQTDQNDFQEELNTTTDIIADLVPRESNTVPTLASFDSFDDSIPVSDFSAMFPYRGTEDDLTVSYEENAAVTFEEENIVPVEEGATALSMNQDFNVNESTHFKHHADGVKLIDLSTPDANSECQVIILMSPGEHDGDGCYSLNYKNLQEEEEWMPPFLGADDFNTDSEEDSLTLPADDVLVASTSSGENPSKPEETNQSFSSPAKKLHEAVVKVHAVVKFTRIQKLKKRARWFSKKLLVFVLSHVGVTTLVGLYAVAGGFLFQYLEGESSFSSRDSMKAIRFRYVKQMWNTTVSLNVLHPVRWQELIAKDLKAFEREIFKAVVDEGWDGSDDYTPSPSSDWSYPSALLFAITVITTIGYGDIAPQTPEGKIACVIYAVLGIPLTLICLANIGSFLATLYRFTWKHTSRLGLILTRAPERNDPLKETAQVRVPISVSVTTMVVYILVGAAIFSKWERWSYLEGSYFCFITLSTIGFGDYVPGQDTGTLESNAKRVVCALYLLFGLALLAMIFQLIQDSVTLVMQRYASALGLSKAQIAKDMEESSADEKDSEEGGDKLAKETMKIETKEERLKKITRENFMKKKPYTQRGGQVYLTESTPLKTSRSFKEIAMAKRMIHRSKTLPSRLQIGNKDTHKQVTKLLSVPEEDVSSKSSPELGGSPFAGKRVKGEVNMEQVRERLCRNYLITRPDKTDEEKSIEPHLDKSDKTDIDKT